MSQIYFIWSNTLHVLDGLCVHHQDFMSVHTATSICLTNACCCMYRHEILLMDRKTVQNM